MSKKAPQKSLIGKVASKSVVKKNASAFETYGNYRKAADIIERADFASGKRVVFKSGTGSTLNFEINRHGAYSTTAQTI
jgi:hypothetical protein